MMMLIDTRCTLTRMIEIISSAETPIPCEFSIFVKTESKFNANIYIFVSRRRLLHMHVNYGLFMDAIHAQPIFVYLPNRKI